MPELPEVETVKRGLLGTIKGKIIKSATIRFKKLRYEIPATIPTLAAGQKVIDVKRRAKYLLVELENGKTLIIHLGMSGKILFKTKLPKEFEKHDHFVIEFTDKAGLVFNDARRFGLVDIADTKKISESKHIKHLGPEPLEDIFNGKYLREFFSNKTKPVKTTIMDQDCVVGVGNIYAAESLFRTGINPTLPAMKVKASKLEAFTANIKQVLLEAIESGGSTLRDYVRSDGDVGYFQHNFKVYGRENHPCHICSTSIKRIVQQGRSTFYCPQCQK